MLGDIGNFLVGSFIGVPIIAWIIIVFILIIYIRIKFFNGSNSKPKPKAGSESEPEKPKTSDQTKKKWNWNWGFHPIVWLKTKDKYQKRNLLLFVLLFLIGVTGSYVWYYQLVVFTTKDIIIIGLLTGVTIVFATTLNFFRWLTIWTAIFIVLYFIGVGIHSLNLPGTPHPIKTVLVSGIVEDSTQIVYDVSEPRWTCYTLDLPDDIVLEIVAEGQYHWDSLDSRGPIGPEGAPWCPNQMMRSHHFIPGLFDKPFAGLIGKVGIDGMVFFIGSACKIEIPKGGDLYIGTNQRWVRPGGQNWRRTWKNATGKVRISAKWESNPQA